MAPADVVALVVVDVADVVAVDYDHVRFLFVCLLARLFVLFYLFPARRIPFGLVVSCLHLGYCSCAAACLPKIASDCTWVRRPTTIT
jgi:hypothetical protein